MSLTTLRTADILAQRYGGRPSEYLQSSYESWCIDEACALAGLHGQQHEEDTILTRADGVKVDLTKAALIESRNGVPTINGSVPYTGVNPPRP